MEVLYYYFILGLLLNYSCEGGDLDYDGKLNIRLDHELDNSPNPSYFHRGDIFIKSLYAGTAVIEESGLNDEQINLLKNLAKKNANYILRAAAKTTGGKVNYYYTFVKACSLAESHLNNIISINLDHNGNVIAVSMVVPNKCVGTETKNEFLRNFNTTIAIRHIEMGPVPDTAAYIHKLEKERDAKERGESKENRTFISKYWIYFVPVALFMFLLSATNPETGGLSQR